MDEAQLYKLLSDLRSSDNDLRKQAEAQYDTVIQTQSAWMMHALSEVGSTSEDSGVVTIALILLRKLFNMSPSPFEAVEAETREVIKGRMLQILGTAAFGPQRSSAATCVSALAVKVFKMETDWSALWESIFQILGDSASACELKIVCCQIISSTAATMAKYFESHADAVTAGMFNCFQAEGEKSKELKCAAFDAVTTLAPLGFLKQLSSLVPAMLTVIQERLNAEDWDGAEQFITSATEGLSHTPALFTDHTLAFLSGMMQVASAPAVPSGARHMAVEAILTFCESEPKTVRKVPQFSTSFFELLFQYTLNPHFTDEWDTTSVQGDEDELEEHSDQAIGSAGLDRLAVALGGRKLHTTAQKLFTENIASSDWKHRYAALMMICYCGEGMSTVFTKMLDGLVQAVIPSVRDPTKYVRASALDCIAQLCTDFAPDMQTRMHALILPPVIDALRDSVPRVAASAARCLDVFFDSAMPEDEELEVMETGTEFAPYVERVCKDCVALLHNTPHVFVRENALGALSSLLSTCKLLLTPYTSDLVTVFREVLAVPDSKEVLQMKCKAIECVTLLACGVGHDVFSPYADDVCHYLSSLCADGLSNDDPRTRFVLRGWTCMVECMKEKVLPHLQPVMPLLLSMMNLQCDAVVENADVGEDAESEEENDNICSLRFILPGVGEKVAKFHTGLIEDKELASNVVNAMLQELGIALRDYLQDIAQSAISLLGFTVNSSIRENGALILNEVMDAYGQAYPAESQAVAIASLPALMTTLAEEQETDVMESLMQVVSRCVSAYPAVITAENAQTVGAKLLAALNAIAEERAKCLSNKASEQDEDELDRLQDEEESLEEGIRSACDLIGTLLERAGVVFAPVFVQHFLPVVSAWFRPEENDFSVRSATVILCDFVEHAPNYIASVLPVICSGVLTFSTTRHDSDLLQTVFYLINLLVQYLGQSSNSSGVDAADFALHAQKAVGQYLAVGEAKTVDYLHCTCNALSAYVSLLNFFATPLQSMVVPMLETVVTILPADGDHIEAKRVHDRLLGWIANQNPILQVVPTARDAILKRIASASSDNLSDEARQRLSSM